MNHGERATSVAAIRDAHGRSIASMPRCPAFPCLRAALDEARGSMLAIGAQNLHTDDRGAFTGEVAAPMLAEMGVRYAIVGHSERRALFGETDAVVARKVAAASRHGLEPILCVGRPKPSATPGA
jgi:triosephosphate isomerase